MKTIIDLINKNEKVYVFLSNDAIREKFMIDAEEQGLSFGDGVKPTQRIADDIMAILPDKTICYLGWAGRMFYKHNPNSVVRIDYEKYIKNQNDYIIDFIKDSEE